MSTPRDLPDAVTVTLAVGLDTIVGYGLAYGPDGEPENGQPITLAGLVADRLARLLLDDAKREVDYPSIRDRINKGINDAIAAKIGNALELSITPTNEYGTPRGEPRTLAEEIVKVAGSWMNATSSGYDRDRGTNAQKLIRDAIGKTLDREIKQVVADAKAEALSKTKAAAAKLFADQFASVKS